MAAKYRNEKKYLIDGITAEIIKARVKPFLRRDPHAGEGGGYRVASLYFDDVYMRAYYQKISGNENRVKFRVRAYNGDDSFIALEAKIKRGGMVAKEQALLTPEQYRGVIGGDYDFLGRRKETAAREFFKQTRRARLKPSVIVDYYREAFILPWGNVRVTVDSEISAGFVDFSADIFGERVLRRSALGSKSVLEIKYDEFLPPYIAEFCASLGLNSLAVSKYVVCADERIW